MQARRSAERVWRLAVKGILGTASGVCLMLALVVDPGAAQSGVAARGAPAVGIPPADGVLFDVGDHGFAALP